MTSTGDFLLVSVTAYACLYTVAVAIMWARAEYRHYRIRKAVAAYNQFIDLLNRSKP